MTPIISILVLLASFGPFGPADDARNAFIKQWQGRRVVVRQTLYSLVYNEHGRLGRVYRDKHEGLTVVTPPAGMFFRFDGRDSEKDITARDAQQVIDVIGEKYRRSLVLDDVGSFGRIEPQLIARYDAGVELFVAGVRFEPDRVRLLLAAAEHAADGAAAPEATSLTVQWPMDLSRTFTERAEIERLIGLFLAF